MNKLFSKQNLIWLGLILFSVSINAEKVKVKVSMASPYILANSQQKTYLKVGLTGFQIKDEKQRTPVNLAIVLDRSGSMHGTKLARAKQAATQAINRLNKNDIVSVVVYDDTVSVVVPASKVSNKEFIQSAINKIVSGGSTALFSGVNSL